MSVVHRAVGCFGAVRVGAAPACPWIVNGARDVFLGLSAKVTKKKSGECKSGGRYGRADRRRVL
jgi:hypothetical protein